MLYYLLGVSLKAVDTSSDVEPGVEYCFCQTKGASNPRRPSCAVYQCQPEIHQIGPQGQRVGMDPTGASLTFDAASQSTSFRAKRIEIT